MLQLTTLCHNNLLTKQTFETFLHSWPDPLQMTGIGMAAAKWRLQEVSYNIPNGCLGGNDEKRIVSIVKTCQNWWKQDERGLKLGLVLTALRLSLGLQGPLCSNASTLDPLGLGCTDSHWFYWLDLCLTLPRCDHNNRIQHVPHPVLIAEKPPVRRRY